MVLELPWGEGWQAVPPGSGLQAELSRELHPDHPLYARSPAVFGRCLTCDDVVAALDDGQGGDLAVIHLTWRGSRELPPFPSHQLLIRADFIARFMKGEEHL